MKKFLRMAGTWTLNSSRAQRMFWHTLIVALAFYISREQAAQFAAQTVNSGINSTTIQIVVFLFVFGVTVLIFRGLLYLGEQLEMELEKERSTKAHAHILCDRALQEELVRADVDSSPQNEAERINTSLTTIQELVAAAYQTFESAYGQLRKTQERIDFEVTYMTPSLRDGKLTVAAAANKDNRMPRSLQLREKEPTIYDRTVSADVFRAPGPRIVIISDTGSDNYKELYPEQKRRIKSSIIFPVLTPNYRLLGTLVVHCDRTGFFDANKEKYFSDLLEIFSKRIALEAVRLNRLAVSIKPEEAPY